MCKIDFNRFVLRGVSTGRKSKMISADDYYDDIEVLTNLEALSKTSVSVKMKIQELRASIQRYEQKHQKQPNHLVICSNCHESLPYKDTLSDPAEEDKGIFASRLCASCLEDITKPHVCDYAGYMGACTDCGTLRCGCIDICRIHWK
jgi:hypothetical protein